MVPLFHLDLDFFFCISEMKIIRFNTNHRRTTVTFSLPVSKDKRGIQKDRSFLIAAYTALILFHFLFQEENSISRGGVLSVSLSPFRQQLTDVMYLITQLNGLPLSTRTSRSCLPSSKDYQRQDFREERGQRFSDEKNTKKLSFQLTQQIKL